jgi:hypothetical protein
MRTITLFLLLSVLCLAGCGTPGAPLPPSLNIPKAVDDLKAVRKADTVTLTWTSPQNTTDGALVKHSGKMKLQRAVLTLGSNASAPASITEVALKPALKNQQSHRVSASDSVAQLLQDANHGDFAVYTVETVNDSGKSAGASNKASVPLVVTPPAPATLSLDVVPTGISISWDQKWGPVNNTHLNIEYAYRIMRRLAGAKDAVTINQINAANEAIKVIDTGIEWEKQYDYWVVPVTLWEGQGEKGEIEGADSPPTQVLAHDIFPPAVPTRVQAVFSGVTQQAFIDLSWTPNSEPDLAGYNVYRRTEGTQPVKINKDLVKAPAFRDPAVQAGTKYFYSVAAVDLRNNESGRSQEASEAVPPQQ